MRVLAAKRGDSQSGRALAGGRRGIAQQPEGNLFLHLQRTMGNQAVQRLLRSYAGPGQGPVPVQAQAAGPRVMRQEKKSHYPTEEEQKQIAELFGRNLQVTVVPSTVPGAPPVVRRGRVLNPDQIREMAARLKDPYYKTLDSLDSDVSSGSPLDEPDAFQVVEQARADIYKKFSGYANRTIALTKDTKSTAEQRRAANRLPVTFFSHAGEGEVQGLARTIITTHCDPCKEVLTLDAASKAAVIGVMVAAANSERAAQLQRVADFRVPGAYDPDAEQLNLRLDSRDDLYHTAVHELIHSLAHPAFRAAFFHDDNINEGFTEYFASEVSSSVRPNYKERVDTVVSARDVIQGPFHFTDATQSAEESLRQAYFRGRLDLIGWQSRSPEEERAVRDAGGSPPWDPTVAKKYADAYVAEAQTLQAAKSNILGVGLYFNQTPDGTAINVRYARVVAQTEPYAKGRLLLEGQLWDAPIRHPSRLGASLGILGEYQEPYFYVHGGVRVLGSAAADDRRVDFSAFGGVGIRAWQKIRVGAEAFVIMPLKGDGVQIGDGPTLGAGATVGVEF